MSTPESIKNQLRALIAQANATTGKSDADVSTAQLSLISGYGQGGSGGSGGEIGPNAKIYYVGRANISLSRDSFGFSSNAST